MALNKLLLSASLAVMTMGLSACDPREFNSELGSAVDEGSFGNPTMNNTLVMTGKVDAQVALGQRFAREVPSTITFAFNSSDLTAESIAVLSHQASWIRQFPEVRFRVYGHTDLVGSNAYNKALGMRRARAVVAYLASQGISTSRLEAVVSYGKTRPVIQTTAPEQRNRRTVTEVSGFVGSNPMVINGKYAAIIMRDYVESAMRPHPQNAPIQTQVNPAGN
jgi:outer membrane protein OmpA-like peptidoglycan-associated protein